LLAEHIRYYRITYNLISAVTLIAPVSFSLLMQRSETVFMAWPDHTGIVRLCLIGTALYMFWSGANHYDMKYFLGISQLRTGRKSPLLNNRNSSFSASGVSSIIRHPWYLGGIILVWSVPENFYPSTMITGIVISAYFFIGIYLEERKLVRCFGETYRAYQRDVSMLIPFKWLSKLFIKHK
jgi:protein-S-isoprenylcysteine O-methyltransferase Ste14